MNQRAFFLILIFLSVLSPKLFSQQPTSFYVVVGVFAIKDNAERFTASLNESNHPASYEFNENRNLYYVYALQTEDRSSAITLVYQLRKVTGLEKTWIYKGGMKQEQAGTETVAEPVAESVDVISEEKMEDTSVPSQNATEPVGAADTTVQENQAEVAKVVRPVKAFVFQVVNASTSAPVSGNVVLLESDEDNDFDVYKANDVVQVRAPENENGRLIIVCQLVGYKYFKKAINFNTISNSTVADPGQTVIPIKLTPNKKGDFVELQNVKFYDKSAIFLPGSEDELSELLNLMGNPRYKISIQAHTPDDGKSDFVTLGESTDYFNLNPLNKSVHGSMKELSEHRARMVKSYLVSKGVSSSRISTKGFGAKLAIYEHSRANDRIEIEILKD
jgi:outer membrane protein OmpA-like peptidoglycan-associated protein